MRWSYGEIVARALLAGAVVGVVLAAYVLVVVEPTIDAAVRLEEAAAGQDGPAPFNSGQQKGGAIVATMVYALVVAGVFGTVYAAIRHRVPAASELARSSWLAAVGFVALALVPALAFPANPPGADTSAGTTASRTLSYGLGLIVAVVVAVALTRLSGVLRTHLSAPTRIVVVTVVGVVAYGLVLVALPSGPDPAAALPADLVWDFRVRSLGALALVWGGIGLGLGWLLDRAALGPAAGTEAVTGDTR